MSEKEERPDAYSGIPWVYVSKEEVWGHPKGRLSLILWAVALYFIISAVAKVVIYTGAGLGLGLAVVSGLFPFLTGVGLILRVPWAIMLAIISASISLFSLMRGMGEGAGIYYLAEALIQAGIVFHLMDGDRPNFVYRHRYRKYSVGESGND